VSGVGLESQPTRRPATNKVANATMDLTFTVEFSSRNESWISQCSARKGVTSRRFQNKRHYTLYTCQGRPPEKR